MFWVNYNRMCLEIGKSPNKVAEECNISSGSVTAWKNGRTPRAENLNKLAEYFGCSIKDLLTEKETPAAQGDGLSSGEAAILAFLRSIPADKVRGILLALEAPKDVLDVLDRGWPQG